MQWHHPVERIMAMTPRQAYAWLTLGVARQAQERAAAIADAALAARGDADELRKTVRRLSDA